MKPSTARARLVKANVCAILNVIFLKRKSQYASGQHSQKICKKQPLTGLVFDYHCAVWGADNGDVGETLGENAVGDNAGDIVDGMFHFQRF